MEPFLVSEGNDGVELKVICIGVGRGGCNVIAHMLNKTLVGIDLIAIGTDTESLAQIDDVKKIQIGSKLVKGLGAGMKPDIGTQASIEDYDEIRTVLEGADIVFILAGLGGGTGTGASPIVAQIAKKVGALTISIVTTPFKFEGKKRSQLAKIGLENIKKESNSVLVIQSDKLLTLIDKRLGLKDAFKVLDGVIEEAINGMASIVLSSEENDINLDFDDLKTVMSHKGMAVMGTGKYNGNNAANEAVKQAMEYVLLENIALNEVTGALIHFNVHPNFLIMEISEAMDIINESVHEDAEVIFGTTTDSSLSEEYVQVIIIFTGFEKKYTQNRVMNNIHFDG
ncbi:MAG: cell division protein FtsZ [Campylobacterota bacterium]|nr:cell division protein FtsZ [Campylobacterota bacterium]